MKRLTSGEEDTITAVTVRRSHALTRPHTQAIAFARTPHLHTRKTVLISTLKPLSKVTRQTERFLWLPHTRSRHPKHHDELQKVHAVAAEGDRTPGGLRAGHALQIGGGGGVVSNHPQCITSERFLWLPYTRSRHPKHHDGLQKVYAGAAEGDRTPGGLGAGHRPKTSGAQGAYSATHGTRWGATARTPLSQQIVTIRKHFRCKISRATLSHCSTLLGFGIAPRKVKCERHFGAARIYGCF